MGKKKIMKIFFADRLTRTLTGYSLGGAFFPEEIVGSIDVPNNALVLKQGWRFAFSKDATTISTPGNNPPIVVGDSRIKKIEINFE